MPLALKKSDCFIRLPILRPVGRPWYSRSYLEWWLISYSNHDLPCAEFNSEGNVFYFMHFIPRPRQIITFIMLVYLYSIFLLEKYLSRLGVVRDTKRAKQMRLTGRVGV